MLNLDFKHDLLLVDLETTGLDATKHEIIQLAAVLLDKKTLAEKASFNTYIKPVRWSKRDPEAMAVNKITEAMLNGAPTLAAVLKDFDAQFDPRKVLLASYVSFTDRWFMKTAYKTTGLSWRFDHHVFDLWPIFFLHRAATDGLRPSKKRFAGFGLEVLKKDLKVSSGKLHDALTDCRVEAEVLRRILKKFSAKK